MREKEVEEAAANLEFEARQSLHAQEQFESQLAEMEALAASMP